ncbi:hypothetical protein VSS74_15770 [Conexibacter stalactiti]|uniref:Uncharacterized protein n=1 Tax=Conexibacter stalactiti TaxID=1940611 RepID=A0ABU4HR51_9ACTN|nr:hypothetical protein [Conexibacter stalactiti]MDW5595806.1 hypothetical protein [Conexibacter stalactiti]MEC5036448.1 hypothetical protein [Conexibacter stalactiti]
MVSRLFLAGACALGLAATSAGSAVADVGPVPTARPQLYIPASVQVWSPAGLVRTIDCPTLTADPTCDPGQWPANIDVHVNGDGGYRLLARNGSWFQLGGNQATVDAIDAADAAGGPGAAKVVGGLEELDPWTPSGAAAGARAAKQAKRAARRAAKRSGKRAAKRGGATVARGNGGAQG